MNHHSSPLINSFQMDSWLANGLWSSLFQPRSRETRAVSAAGPRVTVGGPKSWGWGWVWTWATPTVDDFSSSPWLLNGWLMMMNGKLVVSRCFTYLDSSGIFFWQLHTIAAVPLFNIWNRFYGYLEGLDISIHNQHLKWLGGFGNWELAT